MKKMISMVVIIILIAACEKKSTIENISTVLLKDIDGNEYDTLKIGNQYWMKQNLKTAHYRNGELIPLVTDNAAWNSLSTGAWCWYNNDSATYAASYGKLYNWYAVTDPRGLAPEGWHVPADTEWSTLVTFLGGDPAAGGKMKEAGNAHLVSPNTDATNSSRFTGLPGHFRPFHGQFYGDFGTIGYWWSTTFDGSAGAYCIQLVYNLGESRLNDANGRYGFSVRCLKN